MKISNEIRIRFAFALAIIIIVVGIAGYFKISSNRKATLLSTRVEENVKRIAELSTIKYNYTNIAEYEDNLQLSGINVPFTNKKFILKYSGYIKAGINLETIEINVKDKNSVEIKLGKAEIFDNVIPEEEVHFYDEKDGIFNKLSFKDLYVVLIEEKDKMNKEAIEKGVLNDAEKNNTEIITALMESMGFEKVVIIYN